MKLHYIGSFYEVAAGHIISNDWEALETAQKITKQDLRHAFTRHTDGKTFYTYIGQNNHYEVRGSQNVPVFELR